MKRSRTEFEEQEAQAAETAQMQAIASDFWLKLAEEMQRDMQLAYTSPSATNA